MCIESRCPSASPSSTLPPVDQSLLPLLSGGGEALGKFHTSFSLTVKLLKKQQSQKRMRRHEHHTCSELRHPETGRQTLTHTQAIRPLAAAHQPGLPAGSHPPGRGRRGNRQAIQQPHPRSVSRLSNQPRLGEGGAEKRRGPLHILVSLADSCSGLVPAPHGGVHIPACSEPTGCPWGHPLL